MIPHPLATGIRTLVVLLTATCVSHGATVFSDDFSEADGTAIIGKLPDVGTAWTGTAPNITGSSFNTTGAGRAAFSNFTAVLASGQTLILTYDSLTLSGNNLFGTGYGGVSLYVAGAERVFTGSPSSSTVWGLDGNTVGGVKPGTDGNTVSTVNFTYTYDTGAWSFNTSTGTSLTGTGVPNEAFSGLRVANGAGKDIRVDNLAVQIVPEPSSSLLSLVAAAGLLVRRRR